MLEEKPELEVKTPAKQAAAAAREAIKEALKAKKDNPEKRAQLDHLMALATYMKDMRVPTMEKYFLKILLGTAEKNVLSMAKSHKERFCKECTEFYDMSDETERSRQFL